MSPSIHQGYVLADPRSRFKICFASRNIHDVCDKEALASGKLSELLPEFDLASLGSLVQGQPSAVTTYVRLLDGGYYEVEASIVPVFDAVDRLDFCFFVFDLDPLFACLDIDDQHLEAVAELQ